MVQIPRKTQMKDSKMVNLKERYSRQRLFTPFGEAGQIKLQQARILVVGCGALGTNIANLLVRAGVGMIRIVDRDVVELSNLHRQVLYDENDVANAIPKAQAARAHLEKINHEVVIEAVVADVNPRNIESLIQGVDLVMDGTDNFETRYLINDACVKSKLPWVYGGAIAASSANMAFVPGGPCLACVWPEPPEPGQAENCDTAGVLPTAPAITAALQVTEALKIITGVPVRETLLQIEQWSGQTASVKVSKNPKCTVCGQGRYRYLEKLYTHRKPS